MANLAIKINKLKIVDCADDDEDMDLCLSINIISKGVDSQVFIKELKNVYVEEESKIGNDSRCVYFGGERISNLADVSDVNICVDLKSKDGDGFKWGGQHFHHQSASTLKHGDNNFVERKNNSSNPDTKGVYELDYTLTVI
jgi:hypothetical protein